MCEFWNIFKKNCTVHTYSIRFHSGAIMFKIKLPIYHKIKTAYFFLRKYIRYRRPPLFYCTDACSVIAAACRIHQGPTGGPCKCKQINHLFKWFLWLRSEIKQMMHRIWRSTWYHNILFPELLLSYFFHCCIAEAKSEACRSNARGRPRKFLR